MTCLSRPTAKYLFKVKRVKSRKTILIRRLWSPELCHAAFIFNFEHTQQINLIFFIGNFEHVFVSWALDKIHKTT